ncbi:MAG: vgr related protein [Sphingomonas sp.]|nr:vgr related protein [Sphingomonas sp.]MDX3886156.1 vgr related protein [Sphingomonas sp.]
MAEPPASRPLTTGERALAAGMFGPAIDYDAVRLHRRKWWPLHPPRVVMAPDGHIWFHPESPIWRDDFAQAPVAAQGLFIHEMAHVWQAQRRGRWWLPLMRHPFCRYGYRIRAGWPLDRYGIEQQAEIVRHAFLLRAGCVAPGGATLAQCEAALPADWALPRDGAA